MSQRLRKLTIAMSLLGLVVAALGVGSASAAFGVSGFKFKFVNEDGTVATQAGSHPFALQSYLGLNTRLYGPPLGKTFPDGNVKDIKVQLPTGFVGTATGIPKCPTINFIELVNNGANCPINTVVGAAMTNIPAGNRFANPIFNLEPPPGVAVKLGYIVFSTPVVLEIGVKQSPPYNVVTGFINIPQTSPLYEGFLELWGNPSSHAHDPYRGYGCLRAGEEFGTFTSGGICETDTRDPALFTLPTSCTSPMVTSYATDAYGSSGALFPEGEPDLADPNWISGQVESQDDSVPPRPQPLTGCDRLGFTPTISAQPTTKAAESPSGLDFSLNVNDEGLTNPEGNSQSLIEKAVVTLPEGFETNPSLAEGLNTCSESDLARETLLSEPGAGCPSESKIGTVEVETPLLDESVDGSLYVAKPYENEVGSLIALYMVIKNPKLGIMIKQALKVENNPTTGQITTVAEDLPQLPFSHFKLHFREGTRSPLASPPLCGKYQTSAVLTPRSGGPAVTSTERFELIAGPGGGSCPSGGTPPFHPGLEAGTINNAAGSYSPFYLHMTRNDGEQEITHFSIKLPPGVTGKLAGIPFCSDAAIAAAKARTGPHGGAEEINSPSCPAASEIGRTLVGAGVGPSLAYAPGKVYLAGPYNGSALSIAAITAAKVGPFDLGTVVIRSALKVNPETAEVFIDATGSDPIPHIIKGIPVHLRDIRVYVNRPDFVLNPTNCERTSTASTVLGSGTNFASEGDDVPITVTSPFQAADCASLGFAPKLALTLSGGTKRGDTPGFKAVLTARKGDANIGAAQVTLPHSEFLEQAHIGTVCTRPQFKAGDTPGEKCPAASIYGYAKATTPLLDESLQGPVYLRSSSHQLPDLVAALNSGKINIALAGRIDSVQNGRIRNTFEEVPDAPVTKFTLEMKGGKKGLLVNSTNLCKRTNRAIADFTGQNGKKHVFNPPLVARGCKGKAKKKAKSSKRQAKRLALLAW